VKRWDLRSLPPSTEKRTPRAPHPDAPRVPRRDGQIPRVLFSAPECRVVVLELERDARMGNHHVRERALVHVVEGRVAVDASGETAECAAGDFLTFEPGEPHSVHALDDTTLLLILAPWPAAHHYADAESEHGQHLPANAYLAPIRPPAGGS